MKRPGIPGRFFTRVQSTSRYGFSTSIASFMVVTMIAISVTANKYIFAISHNYPTFTASHCFYKVERKSTGIPNRS